MNSILKKYFSSFKKITKDALSKDEACQFMKDIDSLVKKSHTRKINIAVIGEFNSGKSTFINALLRERILKEAGRPTTAAATYITKSKPRNLWQLLFGSKTRIIIGFDDGQQFVCSNKNYSQCSDYICQSYDIQANSLSEIISVVTAEQLVAKHVVELKMELKTMGLPKDIVIIDTPGFNPGELNFDNHLRITEDVVANMADMAIILTPSTQPMSATLIDFLETNIKRYIHRCVFIVTKIDLIPETERDSVYNYVINQISQLGVQSPKVYGISARTMLPVKYIPESMMDVWPIYQENFCDVEKSLWGNLAKYKNITIREHVFHLMNDLSERIQITINTNTEILQKTLLFLENNNIARIEELTDSLYKSACFLIDKFYAQLQLSSDSYKSSAISLCRPIIRGGGKLRHYKDNEAPQINRTISIQKSNYTSFVQNQLGDSKKIIAEEVSRFREAFHSHYKDMPSLEPKVDFVPSVSDINYGTVDLSISECLNNENSFGRFFQNVSNLFRSEREIQDEVLSEVNDSIESHFIYLEGQMRKSIDNVKESQKKCLKDYCDAHILTYGKQVEALIKQQTQEKNRIENDIRVNNIHIGELQKLQAGIQTEISSLLM